MKRLYVGNIPFKASEEDLRDWFAEAGIQVDNVTLIRDPFTNRLRGFGFVEILDDEAAERAIHTLNGKEFLGRSVVISEARPPRERDTGRRKRGRREY